MMNILIAILCGFVGGMLGAMVIVESKESDKTNEIESLIKGHLAMRDDLSKERDRIGLVDHAVRVLTEQVKRDKGAILGNLNNLWTFIEKMTAQDAPQEAETADIQTKQADPEKLPEKPKEAKKRKKTDEKKEAANDGES